MFSLTGRITGTVYGDARRGLAREAVACTFEGDDGDDAEIMQLKQMDVGATTAWIFHQSVTQQVAVCGHCMKN